MKINKNDVERVWKGIKKTIELIDSILDEPELTPKLNELEKWVEKFPFKDAIKFDNTNTIEANQIKKSTPLVEKTVTKVDGKLVTEVVIEVGTNDFVISKEDNDIHIYTEHTTFIIKVGYPFKYEYNERNGVLTLKAIEIEE